MAKQYMRDMLQTRELDGWLELLNLETHADELRGYLRKVMAGMATLPAFYDNRNILACNKTYTPLNRRGEHGYRGVYKSKKNGKRPWIARIYSPSLGRIHVGSFETAEEAAIAWNKAAIEYLGEKAGELNHIGE